MNSSHRSIIPWLNTSLWILIHELTSMFTYPCRHTNIKMLYFGLIGTVPHTARCTLCFACNPNSSCICLCWKNKSNSNSSWKITSLQSKRFVSGLHESSSVTVAGSLPRVCCSASFFGMVSLARVAKWASVQNRFHSADAYSHGFSIGKLC